MKHIALTILMLAVTVNCFAADLTLSYTISEDKVDEYVAHYVYVHKNTEMISEGEPKYTDKQWVREHIKRTVKKQIRKGRNKKYKDDMSGYNPDGVE